jgi:spore germination protein GerM
MAVALVLGGCATATSGSPSAGSTESSTSASTSAPESSTSESPATSEPVTSEAAETTEASSTTTEPPASDLAETYVYFVVDTRSGLRLSREIRDVPKDDAGATAAIEAMITGAIDPDYSTTWNPDTAVLSAAMEGGVISVDLSGEARTANVGSGGAALMVQQLVWTATEAFAAPDAKVQLTIDGAVAGELWGVLVWDKPVGREAAEDVRTLVQIDSPREGAEVRSPVTVTGDAAAFEANVPWRVLNAAGAEVTSGFTTAAEGMRHAPFSFQVNLAPGSYTVEISEDDPSDGAAGTPGTDTRTMTVLR